MLDSYFVLGLLGLLQAAVLPGHILIRLLRLPLGIVDGLFVTFGLSALVNSVLVQLLVTAHVYTRPVMLGIILVEIVAALVLWRRDEIGRRWDRSARAYAGTFARWTGLRPSAKTVVALAAAGALYGFFSIAHAATYAWQDEAFTLWDNVFSWNRWATEWASNGFPVKTYHYPQLLPTNSSIVYLLTGTTTVQAFNRLYFALYPLLLFCSLADLGLRRREIGYWLAIPVIHLAWMFMARPFPTEGYADVPATFFILVAVHCAFLADEQTEGRSATRWMITAGLFAAAAMVTKQTGLVILLTLPAILALVVRHRERAGTFSKRQAIVWSVIWALLISVPWFVIKEYQIRHGLDQSEATGITVAHGGRGLLARIQNGVTLMSSTWGLAPTLAVAILSLGSLVVRTPWRWVTALVVFPGFAVWSLTTSYDLRNSNFVMILACVSAGVGLGAVLIWLARISSRWSEKAVLAGLLMLACAFGLAASRASSVTNAELKQRSGRSQQTIAMPELNAALLRLVAEHKISRPVVTNYFVMPFIPVLKDYMAYDSLMDVPAFTAVMARANPEFIVVIHPSQNYPAVSETVVSEQVANGLWSIAEVGGSYKIIQVHPAPLPKSERKFSFGVFKTLDGLAPEEGPYPQWDLPVVRWGLGPATRMEFNAPQEEEFELTLGIQHAPVKLTLEVTLNGNTVATTEVSGELNGKDLVYTLKARPGPNQLELRYSVWDTKSETRPLAIMYRTIHILRKEP